jgi:CRP/FNR family transcriptional regulator, anaerobic regulatory protein
MISGARLVPLDCDAGHAEEKSGIVLPRARFSTPCGQCPVRKYSVCRNLSGKDFERMFPHGARIQTMRAGGTLFRQGEPFDQVFTILSGWALTCKVFEDGRRQIIRFVLPGDLIGFEGNEASGMAYSAEAITDLRLCGIRHATFFRDCACSAELAMNFATAVAREALSAWNHVGALGQQTALGRVANLLLDLHRRVTAIGGAEGPAVHLPISQIHIADATGLTPVHVCRTLKQMRLDGLLEFRRERLVLLDPDRLAAIAELDPDIQLDCFAPMPPRVVA